jgi:hypothetical protein
MELDHRLVIFADSARNFITEALFDASGFYKAEVPMGLWFGF